MDVPEGEKRGKRTESLFKEIIGEFPKHMAGTWTFKHKKLTEQLIISMQSDLL